jgi:DNA ligase-1
MTLGDVATASAEVAASSGRLAKISRLAALLTAATTDELAVLVPMVAGEPRQGRLGVAWAQVSAARGTAPADVPTLGLLEVDAALTTLKETKGAGAAARKAQRLGELFRRATGAERDFLTRLIGGELRQGALEGVVVEAVATAAGVPAPHVRRAAMFAGDLAAVAVALRTDGAAALARFDLQVMRPVQPMLADTAETVTEALAGTGDAFVEWKLDGARIQVHKAGDEVRVFSRQLRDVTVAVPEVVAQVRGLPARHLVLDGEVLALHADGRPRPFQDTMRRFGRKLDVEALRGSLPLTPFYFDVLHADGTSWLDEPLHARRAALADLVGGAVTPGLRPATAAEAEAFAADALARGHEGVMVKAVDAAYAAGRRGQAWLKVKVARTLDLVILAAEWGHGRRQGWLSNLHLGARDEAAPGRFVMLGKTFKGLTDEMLAWQTAQLLAREVRREGITVFVRPELVAEIAFNEVQESAQYPGGVALRFARVVRYRGDKTAAEASTIGEVVALRGQ